MKKTEGRELPKSMAKKVVKKVPAKKAVKKVAIKKPKKEEMPRLGIIQIDVKNHKKKEVNNCKN